MAAITSRAMDCVPSFVISVAHPRFPTTRAVSEYRAAFSCPLLARSFHHGRPRESLLIMRADSPHPGDDALAAEDAPSVSIDPGSNQMREIEVGGGKGASADGGGDGDGSRDGNGEGAHSGDGSDGFRPALLAFTSERSQQLQLGLSNVGRFAGSVSVKLQTWTGYLLHGVPAQVLVAIISMVSTLLGARYKAKRDAELEKTVERAQARQKKDQIQQLLRKTYVDLAAPILKSAAKLAERLHVLVDSEWDRIERADVEESLSPAYSAYLLGRYMAMVEILKRERALLDYGFPAADRVLANILGRIQGVFSANDELLIEMQKNEHLFLPGQGQKPLKGGPLRITPRAQMVLGELLLRKLWLGKVDYIDAAEGDEVRRGPKAVVSFLEFSRLLEQEETLKKWYQPVIEEFDQLERVVQRLPREKRRNNAIGARVYFLQSGLLDLVEFFDPLPNAQAVPFYRRRRLQLGKLRYSEEQRAPMSLHILYNELANLRDHRVLGGNTMDRVKLPHGEVEVHVKASPAVPQAGERAVQTAKHGDCPYSHRVLIVLEELGIPYRTVFIPAQAKPAWFYLLHPENRTPVVYHDGNLVEDSKHIVNYLLQRFPDTKRQMGSATKLRLNVGTAAFTRFHDRFVGWVAGDERQRTELERELRLLDGTVGRAQEANDGAPFLGGERFAREDTAIVPMLNNIEVAGRELKRWGIPEDCKALRKYLHAAREMPSFARTVGDQDAIVAGYGHLAVTGGERTWQLADMLE